MRKKEWKAKLKKVVSRDGTKIDFPNNLTFEELKNVTDAAVISLLNETNFKTVVYINLRWCEQITDATVCAIAQNCPNLEPINSACCLYRKRMKQLLSFLWS